MGFQVAQANKRFKELPVSNQSASSMPIYSETQGLILVIFGCASFLGFFYASILSKILPPFENQILSAVQNDRYYCVLVPLTLPVLVIAVYLHWLSMKLFKHA